MEFTIYDMLMLMYPANAYDVSLEVCSPASHVNSRFIDFGISLERRNLSID